MSTIIKKLRVYAMSLIFIGGIIAGCSDVNDASLSDSERLTHIELQTPNSATRTAMVFEDPMIFNGAAPEGGGSATINRNNNGISVQVHATGLTPGNAYTTWFIVFEDGEIDFAGGNPIVVNHAGNHVGVSGMATFSGSLPTGTVKENSNFMALLNPGDGNFDTPRTSAVVIHLVDHGQRGEDADPKTVADNINGIFGLDALSQEYTHVP